MLSFMLHISVAAAVSASYIGKQREFEWGYQIPDRNTGVLTPLGPLHIPLLKNLFIFLSFL